MFLLRRSIWRRLLLSVLLAAVSAVGGAEPAASAPSLNPRYTGSPFVRTWRADDYGAQPENYCAVQHPRTGLIYVGNEAGLLEFDGARWRLIPGSRRGPVIALAIDPRGRLWGIAGGDVCRFEPDARGQLQARSLRDRLPADFGGGGLFGRCVITAEGVWVMTPQTLACLSFDDAPARTWTVATSTAIAIRLWEFGGEAYVMIGGNVTSRMRNGKLEPVPGLTGTVFAGQLEPDGNWRLLMTISTETWDGKKITTRGRLPAGDGGFTAAFLADGRSVFATGRHGVVVCDRDGRILQMIGRKDGLPANQVVDVLPDREGGVWAVTRNGLARVQLDSPYAFHGAAQGLGGTVLSLARHGERLFVGGTEGAAERGPDGRFQPLEDFSTLVRTVFAHDDWLFIQTTRLRALRPGVDRLTRELENRNYFGLAPLPGPLGWYAFGCNEGLRWARFEKDQWVIGEMLAAFRGRTDLLLQAPAGIVWAQGAGSTWRIDFRNGPRVDAPARSFGPADGLPVGPSGMFLLGGNAVAIAAGKLVRFDEAAGRFEPETRIAGLDKLRIARVHASDDGTIWLQGPAPVNAIARLVPAGDDRWRAEWLPGDTLRHLKPSVLYQEASTQTLWIGGNGVLISRDLTWQPTRPATPPVAVVRRIETESGELLAAGAAAPVSAPLPALRPTQDALRISFAAPTFVADHAGVVRTEYRTRLDGLDRAWTAWSKQTERDFTNLPWRAFTFRVQARDDAGRVGPESILAFSITPAWWAARWAWAGYGALGLLGVAGIVRLRTRALHRRAEKLEATIAERTRELAHSNAQLAQRNTQLATSNTELARLNKLELDEKIAAQLAEEKARLEVLRYQLNPHFLYNSLNSIYGLLFENARDAGEMVLRLSEFCRATLTGAKDELPALGAEIDALRSYLDVEKVRWGDKLQVEFEVAPAAEPVRLPPFLLLPLVENAIKYGSHTSPGVLRLKIRAWREGSALHIEIANTGVWLPPNPARRGSTGIGLENLRQRLRRYYPDAHTFRTDARDGWVIASLTIANCEVRLSPSDRELAETRRA